MYPPHHPVIEARDYRIGAHVAGDPDASTAELAGAAQLLAATLPGPGRVDPRILMTRIAGRLGDTEPGRRVRAAITIDHGPRMRAIDALLSPTCMPRDVLSLLGDIDESTDPIVAGSAVTYLDIARSCRVDLDVGITDALAATVGRGPGGVYADAKAAVDQLSGFNVAGRCSNICCLRPCLAVSFPVLLSPSLSCCLLSCLAVSFLVLLSPFCLLRCLAVSSVVLLSL